jgi:hypothetical protein
LSKETVLYEQKGLEHGERSRPAGTIQGTQTWETDPVALSRGRVFLVFFLLAAVLYFQTLACPFLWDEYRLILGNAEAGAFDWQNLPDLFVHRYFHLSGSFKNELPLDLPYYRPVTLLFHGLTFQAVGLFFPVYRLESIFLHVGNSLLLFCLFSILLRKYSSSPHRESIALAAAVLFLAHPRNVETVSIIANQTGLLCSFFCLASLVFWARLLQGGRRPLLLYTLSLTTLLLAMLSKESAYGVPLLHGMVLLLLGPRNRKTLSLLSGFFLLVAIPLGARQAVIGGRSILEAFAKQFARQGSVGDYAASVLGLLFHQLFTWLLPLRIELFQYSFSIEAFSPEQALLPVLVLLLFIWRLRRDKEVLALGVAWFLVFYLPSSNVISIGTLAGGGLKAGAHHLYPAHAGLCLFLAACLLLPFRAVPSTEAGRTAGPGPWLALTLLILVLSAQSFRFAAHFRGADRYYQALIDRHPLATGAWTNYGWHKLYIDKAPQAAERILLGGIEAVRGSPKKATKMDLEHNLLILYRDNGRPIEADTLLQCIKNRWILRPVGDIYFWHAAGLLDESAGSPRGSSRVDPDRGR